MADSQKQKDDANTKGTTQNDDRKSQNVAPENVERTGGAQGNQGDAWNRPTQGTRNMSGYKSFDESDEGPIYGEQKESPLAKNPKPHSKSEGSH